MGEEDPDGVGCNIRRGGIGDFEVDFLSFLILMIMGRGLLLWGHYIIGCGLDALAEGRLDSLLQELHMAFTYDGSLQGVGMSGAICAWASSEASDGM